MKTLPSYFLLFTLFAFFMQTNVQAQKEVPVNDSLVKQDSKLKFGLGFGLNFVGGTNISLAPNLTYPVNDKFGIGAGIQSSYATIPDSRGVFTVGANVLGQYTPIKQLVTLVEFAELYVHTQTDTPAGEIKDDFWESVLFVGAGFNVTNKIAFGAKYNVLYKEDESVYTSPVIPFVNISF